MRPYGRPITIPDQPNGFYQTARDEPDVRIPPLPPTLASRSFDVFAVVYNWTGCSHAVCSRNSVGRAATPSLFAHMSSSGTDNPYPIEAGNDASTCIVGAKARLLPQMTALGFPVPPGFILAIGFFQPWFDVSQRSPSCAAWCAGKPGQWPALFTALRADAANLPFTDEQQFPAALSDRLARHTDLSWPVDRGYE